MKLVQMDEFGIHAELTRLGAFCFATFLLGVTLLCFWHHSPLGWFTLVFTVLYYALASSSDVRRSKG